MTIGRFKDLVMDAPLNDAAGLSRFWAAVLGSTITEAPTGYRVEAAPGEPVETQLWVNPVGEPRIGKTRVHLDLRLPSADVSPLVALGARVLTEPDVDPWWQLTDPDGNVFCAFPPSAVSAPVTRITPFELNVDSGNALELAGWWAGLLGGEVHQAEHKDYCWIAGAAGFPWEMWVFGPVPEPKSVKNRWHWDVTLVDAEGPEPFVAAGATLHRSPDEDVSWWVLSDPEGNEFCLFGRESQ